MQFKDYYAILGVDSKASEQEIKSAYRRAARKYHPDLHAKKDKASAEEKFKEINEAYTVLSDTAKRAEYDRLCALRQSGQDWQYTAGRGPARSSGWGSSQTGSRGAYHSAGRKAGPTVFGEGGETGFDGFSDFFESFFGGQGAGGFYEIYQEERPSRGPDLGSEIALTLPEAYRGGIHSLQLTLQGSCPACGGQGILGGQACPSCGGSGSKASVKKWDVRIPAGVRDGSKIRLKGQGGEGAAGGPPGDLTLTVKLLPHNAFTLIGDDIETSVTIRPEEAVLGCQVRVPTLDGDVMLTVPPMLAAGCRLRLRSKGWPDRNGKRGDEVVRITISIPSSLTDEEKKIYQQLADLHSKAHP